MSPYPTPQMHAAQKRSMYPNMSQQHGPNHQSGVSGGPMQQYPHNIAANGVPVPMQQNYGRAGPMGPASTGVGAGAYGRQAPGMMQQQRQNTPPYQNIAGHQQPQQQQQQPFYGAGYQNVQGYILL